jgi:MFS family permease
LNLLSTRTGRRILFGALYLSEGAPIGFIWWALPTKLRVAGVPVEEITALTSLLVLPWVLKFLWAPLVDTLRSSRWTLRSWIIAAQVTMGVALLPMLFLSLQRDFAIIFPLLLLHAFAAATQDASIDALSIFVVPSNERGAINGWMQAGMLGGRSLFGGGALLLTEYVGERAVVALLIGVVWSSMALVILSQSETAARRNEASTISRRWNEFSIRLKEVLMQKTTWFGLLFALLSAAGFEAVGAVAGPYMIDRGISGEQVGFFFAIPVVVGMLGGALLGGYVSDRIGRRRSVALFLTLFVVNIVILSGTDVLLNSELQWRITALLSTLYFCIGMFTASSYALFMDITNPKLGATQFSAYMGATNGCEAWAVYTVGKLHTAFGYSAAFTIMSFVSLITLLVLRFISPVAGESSEV